MSRGRGRDGFDLRISHDQVGRVVHAAVEHLASFRVSDEDATGVRLRRRANWATWGEDIRMTWCPVRSSVHIDVDIRPTVSMTTQDRGQAAQDVAVLRSDLGAAATTLVPSGYPS